MSEELTMATSEEVVVGTALLDPGLAVRVLGRVRGEHIQNPSLKVVYSAMLDLARQGETVDPVTVAERLKQQGRFEVLGSDGGALYLTHLVDVALLDGEGLDGHIRGLIRSAKERAFHALLRGSLDDLEAGADPSEVLAKVSGGINDLGASLRAEERSEDQLDQIAIELMSVVEAGVPRGWGWPWPRMEESVGRMLPGRMWAVVGYSGSGKSAWLRSLALGLIFGEDEEVHVAYFGMEEAGTDVLGLMACARAEVDYKTFGHGLPLTKEEQAAVAQAVNDIYNTGRFRLNRRRGWGPTELLAKIRQYVEEDGAQIVIIDHAHLIQYPGSTERERDMAVGDFAERLHALADELGFCAVVAYQPRKPDTSATEFRPCSIHDLRGTGRIVNIVENTLSPYRPWVKWDPDWDREKLDLHGRPEIVEPGTKGARLAKNYAYILPGKRRIGGYGGGPVVLDFDSYTGLIHQEIT